MSVLLLLLAAVALVAQQALALPAAVSTSTSVADRLAEEIHNLREILTTGSAQYGIPVIDPLEVKQIPLNANSAKFKATGSLNNLIVKDIASFKVTKLEQITDGGRVTLAIELPTAEASTEYDLHGKVKIGPFNLKLNGKSPVSAKVDGIKANADLDILINSDNSITVENISNIDFSFNEAKVHIDKMNGVVNKLVNQLIPGLVKSNRGKITELIETVGKDNINKYFDVIAGKVPSFKTSIEFQEVLQKVADELVVPPDAHHILRQIARSFHAL